MDWQERFMVSRYGITTTLLIIEVQMCQMCFFSITSYWISSLEKKCSKRAVNQIIRAWFTLCRFLLANIHTMMNESNLELATLDTLACRLEQPGIEPPTCSTSWATATPKMWLQRRYNEAANDGKLGKAMEGRNERMMVLQDSKENTRRNMRGTQEGLGYITTWI